MKCPSVNAGTLVWALALVCFIKATSSLADESSLTKSNDDGNQQMDMSMYKRDWNRNLHSWGKRAWQKLQNGWGKREYWDNNQMYPSNEEKRAWQNLQNGWGKRFSPEDEYAVRQLASMLEQNDMESQSYDNGGVPDVDYDEKRAWRSLNSGGWGKRSEWGNFRGSWGKRDPAWTNLKGIWGKRSIPERTSD